MVPVRARFWIQLTAVLVVAMGAVNVLSALLAHAPHRLQLLHTLLPFQVTRGSRTLTVVAGFLLMLLGKGLWRRKRRAWEFAVLLLAVSLVLHLVKGLDYEEGLGILALILGLVHLRPYYTAKSDPPSALQGLVVLAGALAFTLLYGIAGFRLLRHQFTGIRDLQDALGATLLYFFEFGNRYVHPLTHRARWFLDSIYTVAVLSIGYAVLMLGRPAVLRERPEPEHRDEVERLLREHARTGLAHFALLPDKAYFFNERRTGVVAYKLIGNIALALGDPIAPREEVPALIGTFCDFCAEHDWHPAFYQVVPDFLAAYQRQGLDVLKIGEDANIHLPEFKIAGKKMGGIRHAVNAAERAGIRAERYDLARDEQNRYAQLKEVSDLWLAEHKGSEKTFSLGYFDREWISRYPMMIALDADDRVIAFETLIPMYRANGMAGDLMRRRPDAPKGTMDLVMVRQAQRLQEDGYEWYGQGLSPLSTSEVQESYRSRILDRAVWLFYNYFNFFYGFKGLHAFKDKYQPVWESRYLIYPGSPLLLKTVAAIIRADSTEGMLSFLLKRRATQPRAAGERGSGPGEHRPPDLGAGGGPPPPAPRAGTYRSLRHLNFAAPSSHQQRESFRLSHAIQTSNASKMISEVPPAARNETLEAEASLELSFPPSPREEPAAPPAAPPPAPRPRRLTSLDAFRGLAIVGMLLVNNIALDTATPRSLTHAPWNGGVTFADLVYPWFLLIVGVAIPFSAAAARARGVPFWRYDLKILTRAATLVLLGCLLDSSMIKRPIFDLGVLQQIGLAYLVGAILCELSPLRRCLIAAVFLLAHWAIIRLVPIPGGRPGVFTESTNIIYYLNRVYLQPLSLRGLISLVPMSALVLIGTAVGDELRREVRAPGWKGVRLLGVGLLFVGLGYLWNINLPFNKSVWTSSYILFSAGCGTAVLALFYLSIDVTGWRFWALPLVVFGANAIMAYVTPILVKLYILQEWKWRMPDGSLLSVQDALLHACFTHAGRIQGGWLYTLGYILFWWLVLLHMYRKRVFWRV